MSCIWISKCHIKIFYYMLLNSKPSNYFIHFYPSLHIIIIYQQSTVNWMIDSTHTNVIISKCNMSTKILCNRHMKSLSNVIKYSMACLRNSKRQISLWMEEQRGSHHNSSAYNTFSDYSVHLFKFTHYQMNWFDAQQITYLQLRIKLPEF